MRTRAILAVLAAAVGLTVGVAAAPAARELTPREARDAIARLLGRSAGEVRVKAVSPGLTGNDATVDVQLDVAFQLHRAKDGWQVQSIRMNDRRWEDVELLRRALDAEKTGRAKADLRVIAAGLDAYRRERGGYPNAENLRALVDFLSPGFIPEVIREDPWNGPYAFRLVGDGYELSSNGPDMKTGSDDDIVLGGSGNGQP